MTIKAVIFDAYGTLFDVYSIAGLAEELYPTFGRRVAELWRDRQIDYTRLRTLSGQYATFYQVTRDALQFSLRKLELDASPSSVQRLLEQYDKLEVFPENRAALLRLQSLKLPLAILSNGDPPMLARVLEHSRLGALFTHVLSADSVRRFKTAPEVYQLGPQALGEDPGSILFVSSNGWDACGARWFGYQSFWINRSSQPLEVLGVEPSATGSTMDHVVEFVTSSRARSA